MWGGPPRPMYGAPLYPGPGYAAGPPFMGGPPGPGPSPLQRRPPGVPPPKNTTLWVGRIASTVEEPFIRSLLEACGRVASWKAVTDAETGKLKGFGFVTYEEPQGVLVALQALNDLRVDGQELALKANKATEEYIEWYKAQPPEEGEAAGSGAAGSGAENAALEQVMALISQRPQVAAKQEAVVAAQEFLSTLQEVGGSREDRRASGNADKKRERERELEAEFERERQRQKKEEQRRLEQQERAYKDAVRQWEEHERRRHGDGEKERDRQADLAKERQRQIHADSEAADTDDEAEPWRRRPYRSSRRALERRRRRDLELREDAEDRAKEEAEAAARAAAEDAAQIAAAQAAAQEPGQAAVQEAAGGFDANDAIMAAMMAAVKGDAEQPEAPARLAPVVPKRSRVVTTAFGEDEDEQKPQRKLIPIRYSDEELKAMHAPLQLEEEAEEHTAAANGAAPPAVAPTQLDASTLKKQLMASIPKSWEGIAGFAVQWSQLDSAPADVKERVTGWVSKKVQELLGAPEPSFCEFIVSQLEAHTAPQQMLESLAEVLDEDAPSFTQKLFQVVIYETERLALMG